MYKTVQVISASSKSIYENNNSIIKNIQDFTELIPEGPPLELVVIYKLNISIHDNIKYILEEIYTHNKLPYIRRKSIFKRLLFKLVTKSTYLFQLQF